jgi:hypothetical protein
MANVRKRISELTALNSASLDTVIVGVDNGTTYKIELDVLADAVTNRVNTLDEQRLQSLESVTSSFETKGRNVVSGSSQLTSSFDIRYAISGSITQTTWDNIANKPAGIVSQSTDLSSLNTFTASISTASLVTSIDNLNTFTASQSTSSLVNRLNAIETISGSWITESETGSFLTSLNGTISSSAQITAFGFISSSQTIDTSSFATTGSNTFVGNQIVSGTLNISTNGGDEGGEILLGKAVTNTNITGSGVVVDVFRDRIRIFEEGGTTRGAFLNIVSQSAGVASEIVTSPNLFSIQTITSASYSSLTPVSGTLYIIIG